MKIIIPMAGMGKRMRPHTLTVPKPLLPVAGKTIVQRLIESLNGFYNEPVDEIAFVTGRFGNQVERKLIDIAESFGAKGKIYYQDEALGTAHAVYCAEESLHEEVIVAFADTLFFSNFEITSDADGIIWVYNVEDPSSYGVVKTNLYGVVTDFIEKPKEPVSDQAIIGIYYFKNARLLSDALRYLIDNNIKGNNEYQLTDALEILKDKDVCFKTQPVDKWLDFGNYKASLAAHEIILEETFSKDSLNPEDDNVYYENVTLIPPYYLAPGCQLKNTVVGPGVSVGNNTVIENSVISHSIIQDDSDIKDSVISYSMIGSNVKICKNLNHSSIGDYNEIR